MAADPRDLCVLADVKTASEPAITGTGRDPRIQTLITEASVQIMRELERELTPKANATRRFRVPLGARRRRGTLVDLAPYDLRSATTVRLHPEAATPTVLAATDYALEPFGAPQGGYNQIRLSRYLVFVSDFSLKFDYAQLEIAGAWGLFDTATVPEDVRGACVLTVRSWLRQNPSSYQLPTSDVPPVSPGAPATWEIPTAAMKKLDNWARKAA